MKNESFWPVTLHSSKINTSPETNIKQLNKHFIKLKVGDNQHRSNVYMQSFQFSPPQKKSWSIGSEVSGHT